MTEQTNPSILSESELVEIEKRVAKVPEGPWFAASDPAKECGPHRDSGLALVDTGRESDWPIARLCEWHKARFIAASITDIPALCQTVRALQNERDRAIKLLSPDIPRTDLCDAARQIVFAHALEKGNAESLQEKNAALREQLADAQSENDELAGIIKTHGDTICKQVNAATRMRDACIATVKAMAAEVEHGDALLSARAVIVALESLTLDQVAADSTQKDNEHP